MPTATPTTQSPAFNDELVALLIQQHRSSTRPALQRLWDYYRNELDFDGGDDVRAFSAAQEVGLPRRLREVPTRQGAAGPNRREVVVENDIAWRIHTLVDFMFGRPLTIESAADDRDLAELIERVLRCVIDANGGVTFFQEAALLGSIYGHVDFLLRADQLGPVSKHLSGGSSAADRTSDRAPSRTFDPDRVMRHAAQLQIETVEALRAIPLMNASDYRKLDGYVLHYTQPVNRVDHGSFLSRLVDRSGRNGRQATVEVTERWSADRVRIEHDGRAVEQRANPLGVLPVVHIQNLPQPFCYEGLSEVEPLIPLQDELNTRLCDRANRVTFQSFKMYLGKGIDNFLEMPVAPGQMWMTHNLDATIESFGGDSDSPSEGAHIAEIREAMDKTSSVTAVAAGLLRGKVGNLSSENALRVTLMGLLARTEKKRITYGRGIEQLCGLILHALDVAGVLPTTPNQRRVRLHWPSPLPEDTSQRLKDAEIKLRLGVPREVVLAELGYEPEQRLEATTEGG